MMLKRALYFVLFLSVYCFFLEGREQLILETYTKAEPPIYPGERFIVGYRFLYNTTLDVTEEVLPLLEAEGFKKVGEVRVLEMQEGEWSIQEFAQRVEAVNPGTYHFGPSIISGVTPKGVILEARAPILTLQVLPFASQSKPASFYGAVGSFALKARLLSSSTVSVGEPLHLQLDVIGTRGLQTVILPRLSCLPGISGLFQSSDLPPVGIEDSSSKIFQVTLYPLTSIIEQIPSISLTYFDPKKGEYVTKVTEPISITVLPQKESTSTIASGPSWREALRLQQEDQVAINLPFQLNQKDLESPFLGSWWTALLIPFVVGALGLQYFIKDAQERKKELKRRITAFTKYQAAFNLAELSPNLYPLLIEAFLLRLYEREEIPSSTLSPEKLPTAGLVGEVRSFLCDLEAEKFSGHTTITLDEIYKRAALLWEQLK